MRVVLVSSMLALAGGCGPDFVLVIDGPAADTVLYETQPIDLSASATLDGEPVEVTVDWWTDGWTGSGLSVTIPELPVGTHTVEAVAVHEQLETDVTIELQVEPLPEPTPYGGLQQITIEAGEPGQPDPFVMSCTHKSLELELSFTGSLSGSGTCDLVGDYTFAYVGTVSDEVVSGTMELTSTDAGGEKMNFTGTMLDDGSLTVSFDQTWTNDEGTGYLRVYGSTTAAPE